VAVQAAFPRLVGDAVGRAARVVRSGCRAAPLTGAPPLRPPRRCAHATWPAPLRRTEAQSGPDQRREHHACGGPPPASPKPRRASSASRATATCLSSSPRSVASSTPPRPRRPPLLAPRALTRSGRPPKLYSGRDILRELGALRSGAACWRRSSPRDHQLLASRTGSRRADDHGRICGAGTGSGRQRERMTAAMRAMVELDAQDQGEVLRYMARLRSKRGRP
jgi:hypothetical protein